MPTRFWAIADTHLSFARPKNNDKFGPLWVNHTDTIAAAWRERIQPDDVVLLPGDVSWAATPGRVEPDLAWLDNLPGRKVLLRGNHDHWWRGVDKVRKIIESHCFYALEGDSMILDDVVIAGAMGHIAPQDPYYVADPERDRYTRELTRLEAALQHATSQRLPGQPLILMMHYPPFTSEGKPTAYVDLITRYQPTLCLYGHLHRHAEWEVAHNNVYDGVQYVLVASDYLGMIPRLIWPFDSLDKHLDKQAQADSTIQPSTSAPNEKE